MELYLKSALAGIFFGIWPLVMNRSGLTGIFPVFIFTLIVLVLLFPFTLGNMGTIANVNWLMVIGAGVLGTAAMLLFNGILVKATPQNISLLFVLMLITQIVVQAIYQVAIGGITIMKGFGFFLAAVSAVLLLF